MIFRNFNIIKEHKIFAETVNNKLSELLNENKSYIKNILIYNNFEENTFEIWKNIIDEYVQ